MSMRHAGCVGVGVLVLKEKLFQRPVSAPLLNPTFLGSSGFFMSMASRLVGSHRHKKIRKVGYILGLVWMSLPGPEKEAIFWSMYRDC